MDNPELFTPQKITTYTNFPRTEIKKLKRKSNEEKILKQLSNIAFQVENLQKVATFPEFKPFYEAHDKFQKGVTEIIEASMKKMQEDKDFLLGNSDGAIIMKQNIKILQDALNIALTDIKLRRQNIFASHVDQYIKEVHAEIYDYRDRIRNEPMYQNSIRPFLQLFNTDFKQLYSQFTRLMTPLDFEFIPQKVVNHTIEQLKRLSSTLPSTLLPSVSNSRTAKLITSIFIEKYNAHFLLMIQAMNNAPLFNERIRFLDTSIADLTTEFNLYFSTLQKQKSVEELQKKHRSPPKTQEIKTRQPLVSGDKITAYTLECELGKTKDKLDQALITIAKMKQQSKYNTENTERIQYVLNLIYSRLRPLARKDVTTPEMSPQDKIFKTIGQIEIESADLATKYRKANSIRDKLVQIGLILHQNDGNKDRPRSMSNDELVDDIFDHIQNSFRQKVNGVVKEHSNEPEKIEEMTDEEIIEDLKSRLNQSDKRRNQLCKALKDIDNKNDEADKLDDKELYDKLDSEIQALKDKCSAMDDLRDRVKSTYQKADGDKDESPKEMLDFVDQKLDEAKKAQSRIQDMLKGWFDESEVKDKLTADLLDKLDDFSNKADYAKRNLCDAYKEMTGKDFDLKNGKLSDIFDAISDLVKNKDALREKLISIYKLLGGSKSAVQDKSNLEIANMIEEIVEELGEEIRKLFSSDPGKGSPLVGLIKSLSNKLPRVKTYHKQLVDIHNSLNNKDPDSDCDLDDDDLIRDIHEKSSDIPALRKKLIDCYVDGYPTPESPDNLRKIACKLSNIELVDEISKRSKDRTDSISAMNAALPDSNDKNALPLSIKLISELNELRKTSQRTHDSVANLAKDFPETRCCSDDADVVSSVAQNIGEVLNNSNVFRLILEEKFTKLGGHRDKIRNLDDIGLLKALINLYDTYNYNLIVKIKKRLIEIIGDLAELDGSENIDELLRIIEDLLNRQQKTVTRHRHRKTADAESQTKLDVMESINGLREVLIRITGKKGSTFDGKSVDEMLQIALPKIDEIIGANIDGTSIVFEKIKDLLPQNTNRNQFIDVLREMVLKRNKTNEVSQGIVKHLGDMLKCLSESQKNEDLAQNCENLYNYTQELSNETNYILPHEVESDVHGLIINMVDVLMKSSTKLISLVQNAMGSAELTAKYDESLKSNLLLSKEVSKMRKLIDEKDNQLGIETEKLQTAERTFRSFAESSTALLAKNVREIRQQYLDEKNKSTGATKEE